MTDPEAPAEKAALRRAVLERRRSMTAEDRAVADRRRTAVLLDVAEVRTARVVAAYVSMGTEPGTVAVRDGLRARGLQVLLPVLLPDGDLDWAVDTGAAGLAPGARGLHEPVGARLGPAAVAAADVLLVPAVAVDTAGMRLGRGGGSYDRVLGRATGWACALLHEGELLAPPLPAQPHDARVHAVALPGGLHRVG